MRIFVMRHGQAETLMTTDAARNLTDCGRADVLANAQMSIKELSDIKEIWARPLVRAQQTAEIVQSALREKGVIVDIKTVTDIQPESDPQAIYDALQSAHVDSLLLVSHLPFVGYFIDQFCGSGSGANPMYTSSMAFIECEVAAKACGELRWLRHV